MSECILQAKGGGLGGLAGAGNFASLVTSLRAAKAFKTRLKESVSVGNLTCLYISGQYMYNVNARKIICPQFIVNGVIDRQFTRAGFSVSYVKAYKLSATSQ